MTSACLWIVNRVKSMYVLLFGFIRYCEIASSEFLGNNAALAASVNGPLRKQKGNCHFFDLRFIENRKLNYVGYESRTMNYG